MTPDETDARAAAARRSYNLERFVVAQDRDHLYGRVLEELRAGRKTSHWMWFVFPQVAGLGHSEMSKQFAISSREEARAYLEHPVLGPRLMECTRLVALHHGLDAEDIFGDVDSQKLHSSMTLFMRAAPDIREFAQVISHFFDGFPDQATDALLRD